MQVQQIHKKNWGHFTIIIKSYELPTLVDIILQKFLQLSKQLPMKYD